MVDLLLSQNLVPAASGSLQRDGLTIDCATPDPI